MRISFKFSLLVPHRQCLKLLVALRSVVVVTFGKVLMRLCRVFNMDLQPMTTVLDQRAQYIKVYQETILVAMRLVIGLSNVLDMSQLFKQVQRMFLASLELLRYAINIGKMVDAVGSVPGIFQSTSWGQLMFLDRLGIQVFITTLKRMVIGLEITPSMRLLVIQLIQIVLIEIGSL